MNYFLSADPGQKGGLCVLKSDGTIKDLIPMPDSPKGIASFFYPYTKNSIAYIESVHSLTGQGVKSMFTFGRGTGELIGVLHTLALLNGPLTIKEISPQKWKNAILGKISKIEGESKADRKKRLKQLSIEKAKELYPGVNLMATERSKVESDGLAESILICRYGWMVESKNG